jgi:hypothetical protein
VEVEGFGEGEETEACGGGWGRLGRLNQRNSRVTVGVVNPIRRDLDFFFFSLSGNRTTGLCLQQRA